MQAQSKVTSRTSTGASPGRMCILIQPRSLEMKPEPVIDAEIILCQTGDGQVGFDAAARIEELGIDGAADRLVDIAIGKAVQ